MTWVSADFAIQTPEHLILDRPGATVLSTQVDNMIYQLHTESGAMGSFHISNTAWFGSGDRFEVYGTDGMLFLVLSSLVPALAGRASKSARSSIHTRNSASTALAWMFSASSGRSSAGKRRRTLSGNRRPDDPQARRQGRSAQGVARAWTEFATAINEGTDRSPTCTTPTRSTASGMLPKSRQGSQMGGRGLHVVQ